MGTASYSLFTPNSQSKETVMMNDLPPELGHEELERNAYNAAFYELGLRWHWDSETYAELQRLGPQPAQRIRHYLQTRHPHLLKAYDAEFLAEAILACKGRQKPCAHRTFDWSQAAAPQPGI
jgi:hypothetical protein